MSNNGIIIQARMSSSRLPGKVMKTIGDHPMIWYCVKRAELIGIPVVVATSTDPSDDVLAEYCNSQGFNCFRGSLDNVLDRYIQAAKAFGFTGIYRFTADNLFVHVHYIIENREKIESFAYYDAIHSESFIYGIGFEFAMLAELKGIQTAVTRYLEHVTAYLREHMQGNYHRHIEHGKYSRITGLNLTCDYPEDFQVITAILKYFDFDPEVPVQKVVDFLDRQPELLLINQHRHQPPVN